MSNSHLPSFEWLMPFRGNIPETPFYLYSAERLEQLWQAFGQSIQGSRLPIKLHFPTKANHNPHVLSFFRNKGCGADVVSGYELQFCLQNGFRAEEIIFSGSGKSDEELILAINSQIKMICVESRSELLRLRNLCKKLNKKAQISFRVNPNVDAQTHPYISTGLYEHKFGIDLERALSLFEEASGYSEIETLGVSTHIGSQISKISVFEETLDQILSFVGQLKAKGIHLKVLDLGGGLGIDYKQPELIANFTEYGAVLKRAANAWREFAGTEGHIITECGRALCAQAGVIVTKLIATKKTPHKNFAIMDVSMTEIMRPCLYQSEHLFSRLANNQGSTYLQWQIAGPVCETTDVLVKNFQSPELTEGELFLVQQAGAYGYVMSNHYNLRPMPAEWWITSSNQVIESRPRKQYFGFKLET